MSLKWGKHDVKMIGHQTVAEEATFFSSPELVKSFKDFTRQLGIFKWLCPLFGAKCDEVHTGLICIIKSRKP